MCDTDTYIAMIYSRQNPLHLSSCYQLSFFLGVGAILWVSSVLFGGHIALQCFVRTSDKNSTTLTVTHMYLCNFMYFYVLLLYEKFPGQFPPVLEVVGGFQTDHLGMRVTTCYHPFFLVIAGIWFIIGFA